MTSRVNAPKELEEIAQQVGVPLEDIQEVYCSIFQEGSFTPDLILREVRWFYTELGLDEYYFRRTPISLVAKHIQSLYASKILDKIGGTGEINLEYEQEDLAVYVCRGEHERAIKIERRIEEKYPHHRLQSYRTKGTFSPSSPESYLLFYFLDAPQFKENAPTENRHYPLEEVAAQQFLDGTLPPTVEHYRSVFDEIYNVLGPVVRLSVKEDTNERRICIGYQEGTTHSYFSAVSDVLNSHGIDSNRKYIEHFSNGAIIYNIYIDDTVDEETLQALKEDLNLIYVLTRTSLTPLFQENKLSAQEVVYAYAGWKFTHQFLTRYAKEYHFLSRAFDKDPESLGLLTKMKQRLVKDTFTEGRICDTIFEYHELISELYKDFARYHDLPQTSKELPPFDLQHNQELENKIRKTVLSEVDQEILIGFLTFNRHILKTNFYRSNKVALSFRLDPSFLSEVDYPDRPFGIFFMVGSDFRGFHVRFRDIARGGVRIIRSQNPESFARNVDQLFVENYNLAHTQQKKNKDIPEGGSKGTILLSREHQDKAESAFKKYVDSMLDLLMPNEEIINYGDPNEIIFLGPDEGTADLMNWASHHARRRGYPFWKAFTTGKSLDNGGIPHDLYGMTTRSIHQYVLGILDKLGLQEESLTKFTTGGPDGDLGSNEILLSKDKTIGIVDGSGVLYDPAGIDREELTRLAKARQMISHFDRSKIGEGGFLVLIEDTDITLPDGRLIQSGLNFRNTFHLDPLAKADLFVPCGGRPEAIHINNVEQLFDENKQPRFRFIVEGANLFITQAARLRLEEAGVILFKDASANKGGVTSSSLEVLASLALSDEEFKEEMTIHDDNVPAFYEQYVKEVQQRIVENADLEFECLWREHEETSVPRCILTDKLSDKINLLNDQIQASSLWENEKIKRQVLQEACPKVLLDKIGLDTFIERVPDNYLRAIFGSHLASQYVYKYGLEATELQFIEFIAPYL